MVPSAPDAERIEVFEWLINLPFALQRLHQAKALSALPCEVVERLRIEAQVVDLVTVRKPARLQTDFVLSEFLEREASLIELNERLDVDNMPLHDQRLNRREGSKLLHRRL